MLQISLILNILIFVLTVIGLIWMVGGFGKETVLIVKGFKAFKFFTVDSNVFAGIVCLLYAILMFSTQQGNADTVPHWCVVLKMASTVAVALTMITVVVFLAPNEKKGYFFLFKESNFLFHLLIPVLCIADYIFFVSKDGILFAETLYGALPTVLYGIAYAYNVISHAENGIASEKYDWYGFVKGGVKYALPAIIIIVAASWGISILLWLA